MLDRKSLGVSAGGVDASLLAQIATRGAGNPFALLEFTWAMIDAGAARLDWDIGI